MSTTTTTPRNHEVLDRLLNPVRDILTPDVPQALADLRADPVTQDRIEDLAHRHHEGRLNSDELAEYTALVNAANLIAVLQAKARSVLNRRSA
jgi:hypothetical protein